MFADGQLVGAELGHQVGGGEAVVDGVVEQCLVGGPVKGVLGDFLEVQDAAGLQHAGDLGHSAAPAGNVMDDAEVEHRVVHSALRDERAKVGGVGESHPYPATVGRQAATGAGDHGGIEVDGVHVRGTELLQDDLGAVAGTATDLQDTSVGWQRTAAAPQQRSLVPALQRTPDRIVDHKGFDLVHQHRRQSPFAAAWSADTGCAEVPASLGAGRPGSSMAVAAAASAAAAAVAIKTRVMPCR